MNSSLLTGIVFVTIVALTGNSQANQSGCTPAQSGNSMTFCRGESVLQLGAPGTGRTVNGPYVLIYITDAYSEAFIQSKTGKIKSSLPAMDLAVMRGCNDNGLCVGESVLWSLNGQTQISKVAGLFTGSDIVIERGSPANGNVSYQLVIFGDYKKLETVSNSK